MCCYYWIIRFVLIFIRFFNVFQTKNSWGLEIVQVFELIGDIETKLSWSLYLVVLKNFGYILNEIIEWMFFKFSFKMMIDDKYFDHS
jgi:hypothetical protein